nr:hypothetical protein [Staphylococcus aureus]
ITLIKNGILVLTPRIRISRNERTIFSSACLNDIACVDNFTSNVTINGFPNVEKRPKPDYELASIPTVSSSKIASFSGTKQLL